MSKPINLTDSKADVPDNPRVRRVAKQPTSAAKVLPPGTIPKYIRNRGPNHKPDCTCPFCGTRRRKEKALPFPTGAGRTDLDSTKDAQQAVPIVEDGGIKLLEPFTVEGTVQGYKTKTGHLRTNSRQAQIGKWFEWRLTEPGITNKEVATRLGISPATLKNNIFIAQREGWLKFDDPLDKIEFEIVPQVVENLDYFLKKRDRNVTIETAKGTIFKQYLDSKGITENPNTVLALKIEAAPAQIDGGSVVKTVVVGKPRGVQKKVIDITNQGELNES